jgi:hypothetical protein
MRLRRRTIRALALAMTLATGLAGCATSSAPSSLAVGDCFDVPTSAAITTIPARPCTEPHGGEVFHAFDASGSAASYPSDEAWGQLIYPVCDPAFKTYTGTPVETRTDIDYSYLVPTSDRWAAGDRRVTCFIKSLGQNPMTHSYRSGG